MPGKFRDGVKLWKMKKRIIFLVTDSKEVIKLNITQNKDYLTKPNRNKETLCFYTS